MVAKYINLIFVFYYIWAWFWAHLTSLQQFADLNGEM